MRGYHGLYFVHISSRATHEVRCGTYAMIYLRILPRGSSLATSSVNEPFIEMKSLSRGGQGLRYSLYFIYTLQGVYSRGAYSFLVRQFHTRSSPFKNNLWRGVAMSFNFKFARWILIFYVPGGRTVSSVFLKAKPCAVFIALLESSFFLEMLSPEALPCEALIPSFVCSCDLTFCLHLLA